MCELIVQEDGTQQLPSLWSMRFCGTVKEELQTLKVQDLWLDACFLYPLLRGMDF